MSDATVRVIASVVAGAMMMFTGWVASQVSANQVRIAAGEQQIAELEGKLEFLREKMLELHPMQRSALAWDREED